jgi:hypothetical protein
MSAFPARPLSQNFTGSELGPTCRASSDAKHIRQIAEVAVIPANQTCNSDHKYWPQHVSLAFLAVKKR